MNYPLYSFFIKTISDFMENVTGVRPAPERFRLTKDGRLSTSAFVRGGAPCACEALSGRRGELRFGEAEALTDVSEENGWLVFTLSPAFYVWLADTAAALGSEPRGEFADMRLNMLARKGPAPCPDDERVHAALLRSLFAAERGAFTAEDERAILTMTHGKKGPERLALENACGTAAKALLMLRAAEK